MSPAASEQIADIQEIVNKGKERKCILLLGAGVHYPPPPELTYTCNGRPYVYPEPQRPPLGRQLAEDLAGESGFLTEYPKDNSRSLQRVSLHYEMEKTRNGLVSRVRDAVVTNKAPSPVVRALAELDFPIVTTTNYDRLFETALGLFGKQPFVSIFNKGG